MYLCEKLLNEQYTFFRLDCLVISDRGHTRWIRKFKFGRKAALIDHAEAATRVYRTVGVTAAVPFTHYFV